MAILLIASPHVHTKKSRQKRADDEENFNHEPNTMCREFSVDPGHATCDTATQTLRWAYHPNDDECRSFTFNGCGGNINNFPNFVDCHTFCVERNPPRSADFNMLMEHPDNSFQDIREYILPGDLNGVFKRAFWVQLAEWHEVNPIRITNIETIKEPGEPRKIRVAWRIAKEARLDAGESAQLVLSKMSAPEGLSWTFRTGEGTNVNFNLLRDTTKLYYNDNARDVVFRTEITAFVITSVILSIITIVSVCVLCSKIRKMGKETRLAIQNSKKGMQNAGFEHD